MNYAFSDRVLSLKPSAIREIFKYAADPSVVSLSAGNPSPEAFPVKEIQTITADILSRDPVTPLQYGITEGYLPLRNRLKGRLKEKYAIGSDADELIITAGAQQIMDLTAKSLCNEGDVILCEQPSFIGSLNTFRSYNVKLHGIPMERDGMDLDMLEKALKEEKNVRFIYTIPNFQNPSGLTTSMKKREGIYALAKKYGTLIVEDNPYGDLRYSGEDIPAIKTLDTDGIVIYAGSFSKVISPGLRVGYCVAPAGITAKLIVCKQGQDVHTALLPQMICNEFMEKYDFEAHLQKLRDLYSKKSAFAVRLLREHLSPKISFNDVEGGLFIWCTLPDSTDMPGFCKQAVLRKVAVVPGNAFNADEGMPSSSFRVNFSTPTNEQLERGIKILGEFSKEVL